MAIYATAGSKLYIGGTMALPEADLSESDFTSQAWVEIKSTEGLGSAGDTAQEIKSSLVDRERDVRLKGTRDAGVMEIVCLADGADAGQLAILAAEKTRDNYAFKLVLKDAPPGGTPSERKFVAIVMKAAEQFDQANNAAKLNASLGINSNIVRTAAAAGGA